LTTAVCHATILREETIMLRRRSLWFVVGLLALAICTMHPAFADGRQGRSGWRSGNYGSHSGRSYNSYSNPYLNPYSYESQALPYWLKPGYQSGSGGYGSSAPARRSDRYGAIAYSTSTGACGYSYGHYSQADAERDALARCDAPDRAVIGWMRNAYGALAVGDAPGQYGWGWGVTRTAAEQSALAECRKRTTNCYIKRWVFSGN
jgi:hypothetical protein